MPNFFLETKPASQILFSTTDGLNLPGMLFAPPQKTNKVLLVLHGCGSTDIFYSVMRNQTFSESLNKRGIAYFPFNNRGAHWIKDLDRVTVDGEEETHLGTTFEKIKDCVWDIEGAIAFLTAHGYQEFYLYGHSTGANKAVLYNYLRPKNPISRFIVAGGGDDTGLFYQQINNRGRFFEYLETAMKKITRGQGEQLVPKSWGGGWLSYQSWWDVANPDGDYNIFPFLEFQEKLKLAQKPLFREFQSLVKPTLVVYGEHDRYAYPNSARALEILRTRQNSEAKTSYALIPEADHSFSEKPKEIAELVANWLV